jgi:deoxycytidylate deaminase
MSTRKITRKTVFNYFEIAAKLTFSKKDERSFFLGAVGIRSDGKIVTAINGSSKIPTRQAHCEYRLCTKLDVGSVVYLVRMRRDGLLGNSKPCHNCQKVLKTTGVKRVYYSIGPSEYGVMDF